MTGIITILHYKTMYTVTIKSNRMNKKMHTNVGIWQLKVGRRH